MRAKRVKMMENKKFDEIDKMFENLQKANDETVDSLKDKLRKERPSDLANLKRNSYDMKGSIRIKRPVVPRVLDVSFETRFDYFLYLIQNVNYGTSNVPAYVKGHMAALEKYLNEAKLNPNNLYYTEAALSDEINMMLKESKTDIKTKGYFDGLNYVHKALRRSKEEMAQKINTILKKELS